MDLAVGVIIGVVGLLVGGAVSWLVRSRSLGQVQQQAQVSRTEVAEAMARVEADADRLRNELEAHRGMLAEERQRASGLRGTADQLLVGLEGLLTPAEPVVDEVEAPSDEAVRQAVERALASVERSLEQLTGDLARVRAERDQAESNAAGEVRKREGVEAGLAELQHRGDVLEDRLEGALSSLAKLRAEHERVLEQLATSSDQAARKPRRPGRWRIPTFFNS